MIKIYPSVFNGTIKAPASKSHAQRLLFAASLPTSFTLVKNIPACDDITTTMECLESLGCRLSTNEHGDIIVEPFPKTIPVPTASFNFKKSGTSARIALALAGAFGFRVDARAHACLAKRPLVPLASRMAIRGITFSGFAFPLEMKGRLLGGEYVFRGDEGDEFISSMLMALPLIRDDSTIRLESPLMDSSYIDLTIETLKKFGITIEQLSDGYYIPGMQQYESPGAITAENDWTIASMWTCAGAASASRGGHVKVSELPADSPQMYREINQFLSLISQDFDNISLDLSTCPELATLLAAMAIVKGVNMTVAGLPQLRCMESDRFLVLADIAEALGGHASITENGISIQGNADRPEDCKIDCQDDPYIFMSLALAASVAEKPLILSDERGADKIYANFLTEFQKLGGKFEILNQPFNE